MALQKEICTLILSFCLGVAGLPPQMSAKTIHSAPPFGLGLHYFPQRYTTRVLDTLHKAHFHAPLWADPLPSSPMQLFPTFNRCLKQNLPAIPASLFGASAPSHTRVPLPHGLCAYATSPPHRPSPSALHIQMVPFLPRPYMLEQPQWLPGAQS